MLPISQQSIFVLSSLAYHDYEGVALHDDEKPRLVRDLGDKHFLMLRNHGLLTVGGDDRRRVPADVPVRGRVHDPAARAGGGARADPDRPADHRGRAARRCRQVTRICGGRLAWPGLLRKLDRIDPSWRS